MKRAFVSALVAVSLSGCVSSLDVHRYQPGKAQIGYPYRLRLTQYQVTLTWRVTDCDDTLATDPVKLKLSAEAKETTVLDPEQYYVVDPRSLQGLFRTTEFTMEWYDDRTPKSISSSVDDQSATAVGNVLQAAVKLATTALGAPGGAAKGSCTVEVANALNKIKGDAKTRGQQAIADAAQKAVDDQTALVTRLNAAATTMGATLDDKTRRTLGQARDRLEALMSALTLEQGQLKTLNDVLTDTQTITWPDTGSEFSDTQGFGPSTAAAKRWNLNTSNSSARMFFRLTPLDDPSLAIGNAPPIGTPAHGSTGGAHPPAQDGAPVPAPQPLPPANPAAPDGAPVGPAPTTPPVAPPPARDGAPDLNGAVAESSPPTQRKSLDSHPPEKLPGLPYREPGRVRLDVCTGGPCAGTLETLKANGQFVASTKGLALQAGSMMYLPFQARTFAHIKNSAGFAQAGMLTSAGSSQVRGAGIGLTEAIKTAADQTSTLITAAGTAETKRLTAAADQAKAQKALADAQAALSPAPNADQLAAITAFQTEATLATAEKSKLDAQAALAATKATLGQ